MLFNKMSRGEEDSSHGSSAAIRNAALGRGWTEAPTKFIYGYEPRDGVYDSNEDTERKYDPVIEDRDFAARVYLDTEPGFRARVKVNLGAQDDFLPRGFEQTGEEVRYEITRTGIEVALRDGSADYGRALKEVEKLAELLSEGSMEHYIETKERLERS
ncbi:MAG: hypothetical protein ABEJ91_04040 [Candidatus Nanohaloarchaea archaeon]